MKSVNIVSFLIGLFVVWVLVFLYISLRIIVFGSDTLIDYGETMILMTSIVSSIIVLEGLILFFFIDIKKVKINFVIVYGSAIVSILLFELFFTSTNFLSFLFSP
jgi:hypothetical protein